MKHEFNESDDGKTVEMRFIGNETADAETDAIYQAPHFLQLMYSAWPEANYFRLVCNGKIIFYGQRFFVACMKNL